MSVLTVSPKFLYPHSRQFPFDEVSEKIVRAIERRDWNVPGITLEFDVYGSGEAKYQMVRCIRGDNFKLYFCRIQGSLNSKFNDTAALSSVYIPKQGLEVYEDESGPSYYLYVGKNWEDDKKWFMESIKVNSKMKKEPRRYLRYHGNVYCQRAKELFPDNDLGREYSPEGDEPLKINLEQKFNEFTAWLKEFVLEYILSFPEADVIWPPTVEQKLIPYKGPWETVFSICDWSSAKRIMTGKKEPSKLLPEERHAYIGSGRRLVSLDVKNDGRFPDIAYNGFIWCNANQIKDVTQFTEFTPGVKSAMYSCLNSNYVVAIKPKYANQVYVVDDSKFGETRQQLFRDIAPRGILTDDEISIAYAARGASIVPVNEYKGGYKEPIVLIGRELDFDEIDLLVDIQK